MIGLAIYLFTIFASRVRQYKLGKKAGLVSSPLDMALEFAAFAAWMVIPLIYIFSAWLNFADYPLPDLAGWLGVVIFCAAIWLFGLAYSELGSNWSPRIEIMEEHTLVTSGIFAYIRHPVYAAMFLWSLAEPLLLHNWIAGPGLLVIFIPLYLLRMPSEERMMLDHFGKAYTDYIAQTGRILPRFGIRT